MKTIDLTPQWYRLGLDVRRSRSRRLVHLTGIAAVMMIWLIASEGKLREAQAAMQQTMDHYQQSLDMKKSLDQLLEEHAGLLQQKTRFESVASVLPKHLILTEISHWIPDDVRIANFRIEKIKSDTTTRTSSGGRNRGSNYRQNETMHSDLKVSLVAQSPDIDSLTRFITSLQRSRLFEKVEPKEVKRIKGYDIKQRDIELYVFRREHIGS